MTASTLRSYTCKDLAQMARSEGVNGWHSMRKDELIAALVRVARTRRSSSGSGTNGKSRTKANGKRVDSKTKVPAKPTAAKLRVQRQLAELRAKEAELKSLGTPDRDAGEVDRLVVMVRDPYWLHAFWEISSQSVERGRTALGQGWHGSKPVIRVLKVAADGGAKVERTVEIHGGVNNWYLDVKEPPSSYRLEIGYLAVNGDFYCLSRSNTITTPAPGSAETVDHNWADVAENADRIYAMSGGYSANGASMELQELLEERLRRRLGRPAQIRFGNGAGRPRDNDLRLAIDAELVVYGSTDPNTHVTVKGEPVPVRSDGTFAVKMHLPDRRQVVPVVAGSSDGVEQKTVILGVERNTKVLDPKVRETAS